MSDIFNRLRSGAEKATFEADKVRRIQAIQLKIRSFNQQTEKEYTRVGQVAYALYQEGQISQPELKVACDQLAVVFAQIAAYNREIDQIRAEEYIDSVMTIQHGHICPNGHGQIAPHNNFCQLCGARAIDVSPPNSRSCPHCLASLQPESQFCANCGQEVPSSPAGDICPSCGAFLLDDAAFCTECGHKVGLPDPEEQEEAETAVNEPPAPKVAVEEPEEVFAAKLETGALETAALEEASSPETLVSCPVCNTPLVEDAIFCTECGYRIN